MFFKLPLASIALCVLYLNHVHAHGTITAVKGANGVNGQGFGIIASTPRNGGLPVPFEQDTSIIRDNEIQSGKTGVCGRTKAGGNNDVAQQLSAAASSGLPSAGADGSVTMTLHQVNQDGAGPYTCDVSADGGQTFQDATVTQNVPGVASLSLAVAKDFTLVAQMPAGMACTAGPNGDACIMRCRNKAIAGPFGSCVAVTSGDSGSATGNTTTSAAATTTSATATGADAGTGSTTDTTGTGTGSTTDTTGTGTGATDSTTDTTTGTGSDASTDSTTATGAGAGAGKGNGGGILSKLGKAFGGGRRSASSSDAKKRYIASRVAGKRAGLWMDA